jgi:glycosyltransferase involved in cell wall biosynthesis
MASPPSPDVSVVLSTFNRAAVLAPALDALLEQSGCVLFETVVVDNNSTDATRDIVRARLGRSPRLRYVFEPRQGLPHARNAGIRAALAPIVAFTDDDVRVGPTWVATIKRVFDENPDVDAIGGRVVPTWPGPLPPWFTARQLGPFALGERGDAPIRVDAGNAALCLVGANFAFRRDVFDRIGLFDPDYVKSQDREIQLRLWRAGGVGMYVPEMAISVDVPPERLTKRYFRWWYATYGVYHARMGLIESMDREGRLTAYAGPTLFGTPYFIYRELAASARRWLAGLLRGDETQAFYWENRVRYLLSYVRERRRVHAAAGGGSTFGELLRLASTRAGRRHRPA